MIAKFNDACRGCGEKITPGDEITWTPEGGPRCMECGPEQPDERRGSRSATEDETGAERTMRERVEKLEQAQTEHREQLCALIAWARALAADLDVLPPDEFYTEGEA